MLEALGAGRKHRVFQALSGVSFDVAPGEVVGVMGRNGAGKSTLLRMIAGTLEPTGGSVKVEGRVSAILELGSGFHGDYSGRENVYLGGLCMGLSRDEITRKFDEIVAFSELEAFIDRPFRTYSSGMQARLTFAVATSVDPDVLIIDEALSVGDARFSLKSFDRIRDFKARGKAILFVSHSINQVVSICDRAILLEKGAVVAEGEPNKVGSIYHELLFGAPWAVLDEAPPVQNAEIDSSEISVVGVDQAVPTAEKLARPIRRDWPSMLNNTSRTHRYGDGRLQFSRAAVLDAEGEPKMTLEMGGRYALRIEVVAHDDIDDYCFGMLLRDSRGLDLFGVDTNLANPPMPFPPIKKGEKQAFEMPFVANLAAGTYFVTLGLARSDEHKYDMRFDAIEIMVAPTPYIYSASIVNLSPRFERI